MEYCFRQHQTPKVVIENPPGMRSLKKHKLENMFDQSDIGLHNKLRSSRHNQRQSSGFKENKDEIVMHMSNLPSYLQQVEKEETLQEKALNFGVLDWKRLENWKHGEIYVPGRSCKTESSSKSNSSYLESDPVTLSSTSRSKNLAPQRKQCPSLTFRAPCEGTLSQVVQQTKRKVTTLQDSQAATRSTLDGQTNLYQKDTRKKCSEIKGGKESNQLITTEKEISHSGLENHVRLFSSKDTMSSFKEGCNIANQNCYCNHQNSVIPSSKDPSKKFHSHSFHLLHPGIFFDGKEIEANGKNPSSFPSPKEHRPEDQVLASVDGKATDVNGKRCNFIGTECIELHSVAFHAYSYSNETQNMPCECESREAIKSNVESAGPTELVTSKILYHNFSEQQAARGQDLSHNRRFSFNLSRMSRSLSFKESRESSSVPQLKPSYVSVKSEPLRCASFAGFENSYKETANSSSRARSIPLRKVLEPLLKLKRTHFTGSVQPSINVSSVGVMPTNTSQLVQDKKHVALTVKAFLQLTVKNELPLFKFVIESTSDILVAGLKQLPTKGDPSLIYAFCSVHEIKKKSGWIKQGSKEEIHSFGYNVVGHMKVSSSGIPDIDGQKSEDRFLIRESVLYDVGQANTDVPEFMPERELAAVVMKSPNKILNNDRETSNNENQQIGKFNMREHWNSTTVILPGDIHGLPNKGAPSQLISRWKSGGICDCGGWDMGCKLRILIEHGQPNKNLEPCCPGTYHLFVQNAEQESKPTFSIEPLKNGVFSVEFNATVSSLQAFSISVALIGGGKISDFSEKNNPSQEKLFPGTMNRSCGLKTEITVPGEFSAKYTPFPPPSPIGRV